MVNHASELDTMVRDINTVHNPSSVTRRKNYVWKRGRECALRRQQKHGTSTYKLIPKLKTRLSGMKPRQRNPGENSPK